MMIGLSGMSGNLTWVCQMVNEDEQQIVKLKHLFLNLIESSEEPLTVP